MDRHVGKVDAEGVALGYDYDFTIEIPKAYAAFEITDLGSPGVLHPYVHIKWRAGEQPSGYSNEWTKRYTQTITGWHELKIADNGAGVNLYIDGVALEYNLPTGTGNWDYADTGYAFGYSFQETGAKDSVPSGDFLGHAVSLAIRDIESIWHTQTSSYSFDGGNGSRPRGVLSYQNPDPPNPYTNEYWFAQYYDWAAKKP